MSDQQPSDQHAPLLNISPEDWQEIAARSQHILESFLSRQAPSEPQNADPFNLGSAFSELMSHMLENPQRLIEMQQQFWQNYWQLWQNSAQKFLGQDSASVVEPARDDRRFKDAMWSENAVFDFIKQSYLLSANYLQRSVAETEGLDDHTAHKLNFYTKQFVDAMSPTNFASTNPEVLRATLESRGDNLVKGLKNLLTDLERGKGELNIRMTDDAAFSVGDNLATTPGKVVYQNDLMQLIQYTPATEKVSRTPLLIIPPWINKFYILDLREKNSFIRWAVSKGHTVFVISWVNPDAKLAAKSFEDYMTAGPLAAMDAIEKATGETSCNVIGYCLGGTLLASTIAWLTGVGYEKRVRSATYFTSLVDFEQAGDLRVFIDDSQIHALEDRMRQRGYLEGREMATTFNMLRANDLIWSFVVNNYLLGKDPFPFDLLYWNSDSTRMPAAMHSFYLRNMYQKNLLAKPDGISLKGQAIDLRKIKTPTYILSTKDDHIAPWKATYAATGLYSGPVKFVLSGSGHIAGVVNPEGSDKYGYWTNSRKPANADEWFDSATAHEGSWWADWHKWISKHAGGKVAARTPGDGDLPVLEDAPGSYVKLRIND